MSMGFSGYVSPEQFMKDRADYARKGIAKGRSLIALTYANGILIVAENHSRTLHKVSELYDRVAFAAVGRYNEFDQLRIAGVRAADLRGYSYSREDVDARSLANGYGNMLGHIFTHENKPMEVELLVAEIGMSGDPDDDRLFHITFEGTVVDEDDLMVLGGDAETINDRVKAAYRKSMTLTQALHVARNALAGPDRQLGVRELEVAELSRTNGRRTFRRIEGERLTQLLDEPSGSPADAGSPATSSVPATPEFPAPPTSTEPTGPS